MSYGNIFDILGVSKSGLQVAQIQVDVTGKNVANANDEHYTRQRVVSEALPKNFGNGRHIESGNGIKSVNIQRIFDEYVYTDYRSALSNKEYSSYVQDTLKQISDFFPTLDGNGITAELKNYFDAWSNLTANPNEPASKISLVKISQSLANALNRARSSLTDMQASLNKEVSSYVNELNTLSKEVASVNKEILVATEYQKIDDRITTINELKDRRDSLELAMSKILSIEVDRRIITTQNFYEDAVTQPGEHYVLNVGGFNIIDGVNYSRLEAKSDIGTNSLYNVKYLRQDEKEFDISSKIKNGKLGALLRLRGSYNKQGTSAQGYIADYIKELDKFTEGLINTTNSVYAKTKSDYFATKISGDSSKNIQNGSFFVNMFDRNDVFAGQKEIFIDDSTTIEDIVKQFNSNSDDNSDGSAANDISDKFAAKYIDDVFVIASREDKGKFFISIDDKDTNFAGAISLRKFFTGGDAKTIEVAESLTKKPEHLNSYILTKEGKTLLGNSMVQLQHKKINFYEKGRVEDYTSLGDYYNKIMSILSNDAKIAIENHSTKNVLFKAIETTFDNIGRVSVDEELVNLMKFQAGYVANAKVLTTVDEMINTILGIKQ